MIIRTTQDELPSCLIMFLIWIILNDICNCGSSHQLRVAFWKKKIKNRREPSVLSFLQLAQTTILPASALNILMKQKVYTYQKLLWNFLYLTFQSITYTGRSFCRKKTVNYYISCQKAGPKWVQSWFEIGRSNLRLILDQLCNEFEWTFFDW